MKKKIRIYCKVCKEWKPEHEMVAVDVCEQCFETHDKYGNPKKRGNNGYPE